MSWLIRLHDDFRPEYVQLPEPVRDELLALMVLLREFGPRLGRPRADTLNESEHANMKELRFTADGGVWRVTYAFDPERNGVLLAAGDKSGVSERRVYRQLISKSDARYNDHLIRLNEKEERQHGQHS